MNEAETCRTLVRPKLETVGWRAVERASFYREQMHVTAGRVVLSGSGAKRLKKKIPDFLLYFNRDTPIAVVEAKSDAKPAANGVQQAKEYAALLGLKFAYATNGTDIIEFDAFTQQEREIAVFPTPEALVQRFQTGMGFSATVGDALLVPDFYRADKVPRYYQRIAIDSALRAILGEQKKRCLLTLATGTGKTTVAFQICWKLWSAGWNATGDRTRKPRVLFLADRDKLVSDPMEKDFAPFGNARHRIQGTAERGREMYFALYQALAGDDNRAGLFRQYEPDYFDLIVIDECHRGSANDEGRWRDILTYFAPAYQLGMTATPMREDNRDTYAYFANPLYTYSLKQGIEDGFLAPYRVHRVITSFDAHGWRPVKGQKDKHGHVIPDRLYETKDFERLVSVESRNKIVAKNISDFLKATDPYAKTIIFCVDQDHAYIIKKELHALNTELAHEAQAKGSEYVARVTAAEGDLGRGFLDQFQDPESTFPVILTTSQLLTTGVDAPTCRNVVLFRPVNSSTEFKQIIGRGTRLREDHGKLFFNILDFTGSASKQFADEDFDGDPELATEVEIDEAGKVIRVEVTEEPEQPGEEEGDDSGRIGGGPEPNPYRKLRVGGGPGGIVSVEVSDLAADGTKLRTANVRVFAGELVRELAPDRAALLARWQSPAARDEVLAELANHAIDLHALAAEVGTPAADPFDLLAHLAYNAPLRDRTDRASAVPAALFASFTPSAAEVLRAILNKYAEHGVGQFAVPDVLQVPPLTAFGTVTEIAARFGGVDELLAAVEKLQEAVYAH